MRPAKAFYPACDLLVPSGPRPFFEDKYAAINRRNDFHFHDYAAILLAKTFFVVFAINAAVKGLNFWRGLSFFGPMEWWRPAGMVAARWNLVRTECGPLVQKVADP